MKKTAKKKVASTVKVVVPLNRDVLAKIRNAAHAIGLTVPKYVAISAESDRPF
jgi:hypothetical protein